MSSRIPGDPPPVRYHAAGESGVPAHDDWLTGAEARRLASMRYTKRRDEARLGRWTAKNAVARAFDLSSTPADLADVVIRNAPDGAPEVFLGSRPAGLAISMTDRAGWAVCTVSSGSVAVGCDLELVEPRSALFVEDYFTPDEQELVAGSPEDHDLLANLVWSAKESALKVLREGLRLDTRTVEVSLLADEESGWRSLVVVTTSGARFPGWWTRFGEFVLTYCATTEAGPPQSIDEPPPLAAAVPAHSWLANPMHEPS